MAFMNDWIHSLRKKCNTCPAEEPPMHSFLNILFQQLETCKFHKQYSWFSLLPKHFPLEKKSQFSPSSFFQAGTCLYHSPISKRYRMAWLTQQKEWCCFNFLIFFYCYYLFIFKNAKSVCSFGRAKINFSTQLKIEPPPQKKNQQHVKKQEVLDK